MRSLAAKASVHPNAFVRLARLIGFEGYDDLRERFRVDRALRVEQLHVGDPLVELVRLGERQRCEGPFAVAQAVATAIGSAPSVKPPMAETVTPSRRNLWTMSANNVPTQKAPSARSVVCLQST